MEQAWHIIRYPYAALLIACFVAQFIASRKLTGERERSGRWIGWSTFMCVNLPLWVSVMFGYRRAGRILALVVLPIVVVATMILIRMARAQKYPEQPWTKAGLERFKC